MTVRTRLHPALRRPGRNPSGAVHDSELPDELRLFSEYLTDARYGWAAECEAEFGRGVYPVPICHEWNTIAHLTIKDGEPTRRQVGQGRVTRRDYLPDCPG